MTALITAALACCARGWPVVPLHSIRRGVCSCPAGACCDDGPGKHPRTRHGLSDATTDEGQIRAWWRCWPDANIAIRCDHLFVLDVDPRNGGDAALAELELLNGTLPETLTIRTGSGGAHHYMTAPPASWRKTIGPGLDVQAGRGKYVVAPPSGHISGNDYRVEVAAPIAPAPRWLLELATRPAAPPPTPAPPPIDLDLALAKRVRAWLAKADPAVSGSGHAGAQTLLTCQHVVRGFGLADDDAYALLAEWNARCEPPWSEKELRRKIHEAREVGTKVAWGAHGKTHLSTRPPPHDDDEVPHWLRRSSS